MQIGFINFNTDEKKRVAKMMQLLQESEAIEELGIGRVRDHFSNTLFLGISTLQHHAKYFAVMPSLYYHTAYKSKKFQTIAEVDRYIKEAEVQITRQLSENPDGTLKMDATGITGINTYKDAINDYRKFVKYDPAYIYGSGLAKYGIIPDTGIERLILELNRKHYADPHNKKMLKNEDETNDAGDFADDKQVIKTCGESYQFFDGKTMSLALSEKEATFLKDRINNTCQGTLLLFLIDGKSDIPVNMEYYGINKLLEDVTPDVVDIYHKSVLFSKLIHLIDWRFNYSYFNCFGNTDAAVSCDKEYNTLLTDHKGTLESSTAYHLLFDYIRPIDAMLTEFCESCYKAILEGRPEVVDQLVKAREHTVKRDRSKIGNKAYKDQGRGKPLPNTFRWETVKTIVNEIRNPQ